MTCPPQRSVRAVASRPSRGRRRRPALLLVACAACACSPVDAAEPAAPEWTDGPGYRWTALEVPTGRVGFTAVPAETSGLRFTNSLSEQANAANRVLSNGAGLASGDINNDGRPDLFFCSLEGRNALYLNLGQWRFRDATAESGLGTALPATRGATFADLNGDGALDLVLAVTGRGALVFQNDGQGRFRNVTSQAGTAANTGSTTLALADIDANGTLDLYVTNYRTEDVRDKGRVNLVMVQGRPTLRGSETNRFRIQNGRLEEAGQPDVLYLNDGAGRFRAVPWTQGAFLDEAGQSLTEAPPDWGLTATFRDVNGDLAPDLYVFNDYWTPDRFWINDGTGRFRAIARQAVRKTPASSMSGDFADLDRDGRVDLLAVDMLARDPRMRKRQMYAQATVPTPPGVLDDRPQVVRNTLFRHNDDGTFSELAHFAAIPASDWSWSPIFLDVDLDGYEDLIIGAGHFRDVQDMDAEREIQSRQHSWDHLPDLAARQSAFTRELLEHYRLYPLLQMPIVCYRNRHDWTFEETTDRWGLHPPGVHQGLALADFDGDGDLDLAVNNLNAAATLFRNACPGPRIHVRLRGRPGNTQAIGAHLTLESNTLPRQSTELLCGGRYQSGSDPVAVFAIAPSDTNATLEIRWRNGTRSRWTGIQANRRYEIPEPDPQPVPASPAPIPNPLFEDVSPRLAHQHTETPFDDLSRQPLLPFKLSQLGPGVAWSDLDGDADDDLVVGAGQGGAPAVFLNDGRGGFTASPLAEPFAAPSDLAGILGYALGTNPPAFLALTTGYEDPQGTNPFSGQLVNGRIQRNPNRTGEVGAGGAVALGDLQGDGRLALFVAGGVSPGQYPRGAPSRLYRWDGTRWTLDARNSTPLDNLGIVNAAVWTDLTGDGMPELVLACEWGPLRVFRNRGGLLFDVTATVGLAEHVGWWRGVNAVDLDGDGRLDLVASNWGLNSPYRASPQQPLVFASGQLAQPGVVDLIETEYVDGTLAPRRQLPALARSLPFLVESFPTYLAYSEASLAQVLGDRAPLATLSRATTLHSTAFLNRGDRFEPVPLPLEAQLAPAFAVVTADFDGDGGEDVFLSQNFFDLHGEDSRIDAGRGLLLRGNGRGGFLPMPSPRSGIAVYGQQRGAAAADFDADGRTDLVVTQNGTSTRLFRNRTAPPGLRVSLLGPPGNPSAIGAVLRLESALGDGPARELHAGSGYWSQDSTTAVLHTPNGPPKSVWVRWPGGRVTRSPVPVGANSLVVDHRAAAEEKTR